MQRDTFDVRNVDVRGLRMEVATAGAGPGVLLIHGIPHTRFLWRRVIAGLADRYFVIAPDLRGLGGTERARSGFDVATVAGDLAGLLEVLGVASVAAVGIDLGVQTAFMLAMTSPGRVRRMALMEGLVGALPGAESFLSRGAPWWFGFHSVPELPETLIAGHEAAYVDYFLSNGTYGRRGIAREAREAFVRAYSGVHLSGPSPGTARGPAHWHRRRGELRQACGRREATWAPHGGGGQPVHGPARWSGDSQRLRGVRG